MAYVDLTARFIYELQTVFGDFSKLANNDKYIKENGWQDGTVGVFFQAAAPTGWTKIVTADARALRVVSGSGGGVGGVTDPATTITLAHTHTISTDGTHTHALSTHTHHVATSGTDKSNGVSVIPIITIGNNELVLRNGAGANSVHSKANAMPMSGSYTTGSDGSHNHGGATDSQLTNVTLAYVNVIFCSKDTSSGYTDLSATFVHNVRHVFDYLDECAENDAYNYARQTPTGTVSLFGSATAPTGWTKLTTANAALLRVVSGTGAGSGGTADPSTTISLAHSHGNFTAGGSHTHTVPGHQHLMSDLNSYTTAAASNVLSTSGGQMREYQLSAAGSAGLQAITDVDGSGTTAADGSHTHTPGDALVNISLAYFNVIQASKDSAGAPAAYTDYTTFFVDQDLLAYQDLQVMANNDAYLYYHIIPSAAVMFFFQSSAPLNWTKLATQNDKLLRIVSGTDGGSSGGSDLLSTGITLAHTHTIPSASHLHSYGHTHSLKSTGSSSLGTLINNTRIYGANGAEIYRAQNGGAGDTSLGVTTDSQTALTDSAAHTHTGLTGSSLSNLNIAYADVIMCSKN